MPETRRFLSTRAALLMLSLAVSVPAWAQPPVVTDAVVKAAAPRIDNFGQVSKTYYRGAQPKGQDFTALAALGIKTVIDLTADGDPTEEAAVRTLGMSFVRIPMTTHAVPTAAQLDQFLKLVNDAASQPVYVHCQGGRHRTGVMTAIYRMSGEDWSADKAFGEMKKFKFGPDFLHPEFKQFVYSYRSELDRAHAAAAQAATATKTGGS